MGRKILIFFIIFLFSAPLFSQQIHFAPWYKVNLLKGRSFKQLSIDYNDFSSGGKYANLNGALVLKIGEGLFHQVGRILDNECFYSSPGNFCDYNFLPPLVDSGLKVDSSGNSLHDAGGLRTVPYEPRNHRNTACQNDVPSGATCNGQRDIYPNGSSCNFWWVNKEATDLSVGYLWIYPNGRWEEHYETPIAPRSGSYSVNFGSDDTSCDSTGVSDPEDCAISNCKYCTTSQESNGVANQAGHYCYPGDDQAVYVDSGNLYFDPNATYSKFRDNWGSLISTHKGYTFPYHYFYPDQSPYTDGSTWDGADLIQIGFCPAGSGGCGDYPEDSLTLELKIPNIYAEIGVHAAGAEQEGRAWWDAMRPDAYIRLFLWDDTSDTSPSPGCDTDDDNNACNDNINDPDGLDADVDVTAVHFDGFNAKTDGNLSGVIDAIANALEGTIANIIKNALSNGIKSALASAFPIDMNNLLGNPWNTGTGLLDVGIYPSTSLPSDGNGNKVVPVYCSDGSTSQKTVNATYVNGGKWDAPLTYCGFVLPAAVAVEPILFNSNCSRDTDLSNPEPTDFFGICTLHNYDGSEDDDQQFDMNDGNGSDYYGPPLIYKANAPSQDVIPPHLDTIQQIQYYGSGKNSWGNYDTVLYDANHNDIKDDGSCSDSGFTDSNHDGLDDNNSNCALYDMALAIHYNFLSQALYSMYASGLLDYAISATEPIGSSRRKVTFLSQSMLKQLLNVNTFSSIIPVLKSIAKDNSYVAIRAVPRSTPYAKTGVDHYDNTTYGVPGTKGTGTYDVRLYFPGVDFEFWFQDKNGVYKRIFTLRWNLLAGLDIEFYKGCHPLDPAAGTSRCTDPDDPAYIPGYLMIYAEINNPDVMGTLGYDPVQVIESEIDIDTGILHNQISNLLGILLSAFVELKIEMRMPRLILGDTLAQGLTFDIWYFGPDGPSATNTTKGDYLGVYLSLLGNVNIFNLMGNLSLTGGAPSWKNMYPDTTIVAPAFPDNNKIVTLSAEDFKSLGFSRNNVAFSWDGNSDYENNSDLIYTYRIDGGLWHPPVHKRITNFHFLPDGRHVFEVAAIHHIGPYQFIDPTPARVEFTIDTTPPEIHFIGGTEYTSGDSIIVNVNDFPESSYGDVQISWSIDGKKFTDWTESRLIPLAGLEKGTHRLVVKAKDSAENIAQKGLIFEVKERSGFGCSSGDSMDGLLMLIGLISGFLLFKNIVRRA